MTYSRLPQLKNVKPFKFIALDMEQDNKGVPYLYVVARRNGKGEIKHDVYPKGKFEDLVDFLFCKTHPHTYMTGMNVGFDIRPLMKYGFDWKVIESGGNFISCFPSKEQVRALDKKAIKVMDIGNFTYHTPIKDSYEALGSPAGEYIDKHILEREGEEVMLEACKSHATAALIVSEEMQKQVMYMKTNIEITPALTAQKLHLRNHLSKRCQVIRELTFDEKLFQYQCYFGGRTECFVKGFFPHATGIDINSSYPYEMSIRDFPDLEDYRIEEGVSMKRLMYLMDKYEGNAKVEVTTNDDLITLLPHVSEGKLLFPKGTFIGNFTFPELREALKEGYTINEVYSVGFAKATKDPFFKSYVDEMYKLKLTKNYKLAAKLLMNSLYGKFGQKGNEPSGWITLDHDEWVILSEGGDIGYDVQHVDGYLCKYVPETPIEERGFARKSMPLIAAYVTAYARIHLFKTMKAIGFENVYYTDTDSVYGEAKAVHDAIERGDIWADPDKLGAWDIEHDDVRMEIRGLKYYRLHENGEWKYTVKGVPKRSHRDFWRDKIVAFYRPNKYNSMVRFGKDLNKFERHTRSDQNPTDKRYFVSNKESYPYELS